MKIRNWEEFQHYKDRSPPWIKLHKSLLDNFEFQSLPLASRALAPMLWLLASEKLDGDFDGDPAKLAFRLRRTEKEIVDGLNPLIESGFVIADSVVLAKSKQRAIPETEGETEREEEKRQKPRTSALEDAFGQFWKSFPKKVGKAAALKAWEKAKPDLQAVLKAIEWQKESDQWRKDGGQFIPHPATWLNQGRWDDAPVEAGAVKPKERPWYIGGWSGIVAKGVEVGIVENRDLFGPSLKAAIFRHYSITQQMVEQANREWE